MHINTFAGHPAACAAALTNLDILESEQIVENAASLESTLQQSLERAAASVPNAYRANTAGLLKTVAVALTQRRASLDYVRLSVKAMVDAWLGRMGRRVDPPTGNAPSAAERTS